MTILRWLVFGIFSITAGLVHAENGCPAGFQPTGAAPSPQDPVACRPIQENGQEVPTPQPRWAALWGAIATDGPGGSFGASTNMATRKAAEIAARTECRSKKGSTSCKVELSYVNQCAAMVAGDTGYNTQAGLTIDLAIEAGMKTCNAADTHCYAYYTGCSLPMRIL